MKISLRFHLLLFSFLVLMLCSSVQAKENNSSTMARPYATEQQTIDNITSFIAQSPPLEKAEETRKSLKNTLLVLKGYTTQKEKELDQLNTSLVDIDTTNTISSSLPNLWDPTNATASAYPAEWAEMSLPEVMDQVRKKTEERYLKMILQKTGGRITEGAKMAGITTRSLYSKMREYGLKKESYKKQVKK